MSAHTDKNKRSAYFSFLKEDVIEEAFARIALAGLRETAIVNLPRAGTYMAARLRSANTLCALALDGNGRFISDLTIKMGARRDLDSICSALISLAGKTGAVYMILGVSRKMPSKILVPLNFVYEQMLSHGVTILDVIAAENGVYSSLFKTLSDNEGGAYSPFTQK